VGGGGQVNVVHADPVPGHDLAGGQLAEQLAGDRQVGVEQRVGVPAEAGDAVGGAVGDLDPGADRG
jgi:hypothetical protein